MEKKRYRKMLQAYVSAFMAGHEGAGAGLKWVRRADPVVLGSYRNYAEAWAAMAPCAAQYIKVK